MDIRLLKADEVDARVQSVKENGLILLLYKDARCDMKILDETFGIFGWQRKHEVINENLFCTVSIYDKEKQQLNVLLSIIQRIRVCLSYQMMLHLMKILTRTF